MGYFAVSTERIDEVFDILHVIYTTLFMSYVNMIYVFPVDILRNMTETPAHRLRIARKKAGYDTAADAADALGVKPSTYRAHENTQNDLPPKAAQKYAKRFGVSVSWILFNDSTGRDDKSAPLAQEHEESIAPGTSEKRHVVDLFTLRTVLLAVRRNKFYLGDPEEFTDFVIDTCIVVEEEGVDVKNDADSNVIDLLVRLRINERKRSQDKTEGGQSVSKAKES